MQYVLHDRSNSSFAPIYWLLHYLILKNIVLRHPSVAPFAKRAISTQRLAQDTLGNISFLLGSRLSLAIFSETVAGDIFLISQKIIILYFFMLWPISSPLTR
jgi:hypothetical protein